MWSVVQPLYDPCYMDPVASLGTVFTVFAALFSGASRTTIGSSYKLQLEDRTTLGLNGVAPDRSWDTGPSYA